MQLPPQAVESVWVALHVPPQSVKPVAQTQEPDPLQTLPPVHAVPHPPQLALSVLVLVQVPEQLVEDLLKNAQ